MSIVIVIIGLLIGSIFWGAGILRNTQIRYLVDDLDRYQKAVHMFYDRYNAQHTLHWADFISRAFFVT